MEIDTMTQTRRNPLDDLNTFIRYLLYSDQLDMEGLIYPSSIFHWKGDGKGNLFQGSRNIPII